MSHGPDDEVDTGGAPTPGSVPASGICAHCGAELPPGALFCGECGRPVGSVPTPTRSDTMIIPPQDLDAIAARRMGGAWPAPRPELEPGSGHEPGAGHEPGPEHEPGPDASPSPSPADAEPADASEGGRVEADLDPVDRILRGEPPVPASEHPQHPETVLEKARAALGGWAEARRRLGQTAWPEAPVSEPRTSTEEPLRGAGVDDTDGDAGHDARDHQHDDPLRDALPEQQDRDEVPPAFRAEHPVPPPDPGPMLPPPVPATWASRTRLVEPPSADRPFEVRTVPPLRTSAPRSSFAPRSTPPASAPVPPVTAVSPPTVPAVTPPSVPAVPERSAGPAHPMSPSTAAPGVRPEPVGAVRRADEDVEATRIVARTPAGARFVLQFSTGEQAIVAGSGLLGRNPTPEPTEYFDHLLAIVDPGKSVSKTHLEFGQQEGEFWVLDRFSGNGSVLREPDADPRRLEPGRRYRVQRGSRIEIGEQFVIVS